MQIKLKEQSVDELPEEAIREAHLLHMHVVHVTCEDPESETGEQCRFFAYVPFVPRVGEEIILENGTVCGVERVYFKKATSSSGRLALLVPHVDAILMDDEEFLSLGRIRISDD